MRLTTVHSSPSIPSAILNQIVVATSRSRCETKRQKMIIRAKDTFRPPNRECLLKILSASRAFLDEISVSITERVHFTAKSFPHVPRLSACSSTGPRGVRWTYQTSIVNGRGAGFSGSSLFVSIAALPLCKVALELEASKCCLNFIQDGHNSET